MNGLRGAACRLGSVTKVSAQEYRRLRGKDRAVGLAGDISDEMLAAVMAAKAPEAASAFDHEVK